MAALSRSASASTISGVELPSSSDTFFLWARWRMPQPTCDEPVKVIIFTRSSSVSTSPISPERPTITFSQPAGWPASANARASNSAESGVAPAGFSTTAQPAAKPGPTLWQTRFSGKLNGEIAPTIPIGRRRIRPALPSPAGCASIGTVSPVSRRASSAEKVIVCTARSTSMPAVAIGLPASWAIVARELLAPLREQRGHPVQHRRALVRRQRALHRPLGRVDRAASRRRAAAERHAPDHAAVVGRRHVLRLAGLVPLAVHVQLLDCLSHRHCQTPSPTFTRSARFIENFLFSR